MEFLFYTILSNTQPKNFKMTLKWMSFLKTCLKVAYSFLELLNVDAIPLFFLF